MSLARRRYAPHMDADAGGMEESAATSAAPPANRPMAATLIPHMLAAILVESTATAGVAMMPFIAIREFGAAEWGTALITSAPTTFLLGSIVWDVLFRRVRSHTYLLVFWAAALVPISLISLVHGYWALLACLATAAAGMAGLFPFKGSLLRALYPDALRGRVTATLNVVVILNTVWMVWCFGVQQKADPQAFRTLLPLLGAAQVVGIALYIWLARRLPRNPESARETGASALMRLLTPIRGLRDTLARDPRFAAFERAFMTYGAAYSFCEVLVPLIVAARLHLNYDEIASSTRVVFQLSVVALAFPAGWLMDRVGPSRLCSAAYLLLAAYPILLLRAGTALDVAMASAVFGLAMAGVQQSWMLGPVALAPSPDRVSQYVAIHATLAGVRGLPAQAIGMAIYTMTGSLTWPLVGACAIFVWAAWQMAGVQRVPAQIRLATSNIPPPT